jgi:DNA-binding transcriptional MocR family regulator
MRHAGEAALDRLDGLLQQVRRRHPELRERKRGAFYRNGQGWLHFHEDPAGLFADLKVEGDWARCAVDTAAQRKALLERLAETLTPAVPA